MKDNFLFTLLLVVVVLLATMHAQTPPIVYVAGDGSGDYNCDGNSDQVEINQALNFVATNANYTTVYLKGANTYWIDEPIVILSNTTLTGDASAKVQVVANAGWVDNKPMLAQSGGQYWENGADWDSGDTGEEQLIKQIYGTANNSLTNVEISGFELTTGTQSGASAGGYEYLIMIFYNATNLKVHDMHIHDNYGDFIRIMTVGTPVISDSLKFYNNLMESSGHDAFYITYATNLEFYNNKIYYIRTNIGIRTEECNNISIYGNTIGNAIHKDPSGYAGIFIKNTNSVKLDSAEIYDNYVYGRAGGIVLNGGSTKDFLQNAHIHHNRIFNVFDNTLGGDNYLNGGVHIHGAHNTLVEYNSIETSDKDGIVFEIGDGVENGYQTIVRNNIITNCTGYGLNNKNPAQHSFTSSYNNIYNSTSGNYNNASSSSDITTNPLYANAPFGSGWHYIVGTYDNTTEICKLYVDGKENASMHYPSFGSIGTNDVPLYLGGYLGDYYQLEGRLDEVALWNRSLNASEISVLWNNGSGKNITGAALTTNLMAYWQMENNWNDSHGSYNAIASNASFTTDAKLGTNAGAFSTSYVAYPNNISPTSAITIAAWVYRNEASIAGDNIETLLNKGKQNKNNHIWLYAKGTKFYFELGNGTERHSTGAGSVTPEQLDLHLTSTGGRWDGTQWVNDASTSPCVDMGDPTSDYSNEPSPNGNRVNMGAYGNTTEASKKETPVPVQLNMFLAHFDKLNNYVLLNWETATEVNNYGFYIERFETEKNDWRTLSFIEGHGHSQSPQTYSFVDSTITQNGKYLYRLKQIDTDGTFEYSTIISLNISILNKFKLFPNYPNPFNPTTNISFDLPNDSDVHLTIVNVLGEVVANLVNEKLKAGFHKYTFNASALASGVYYYRIVTERYTETKSMIFIK